MKRPYLVFTSAGDSSDAFFDWLEVSKKYRSYNTAVVYYGNDNSRWERIQKYADHSWRHPGFVWTSFIRYYPELKNHLYSLIIDDDLKISAEVINKVFGFARRKGASALQLSHDAKGHISYPLFSQNPSLHYRECNFIEQCFMMIKNDLLGMLVEKWKAFNLVHVTGVDIVLANVARQNNMLPFIMLDKFSFYNPHPHEKPNGREIEQAYKTSEKFHQRLDKLKTLIKENPDFFQIGPSGLSNVWFPIDVSVTDPMI